MEKEKLRSVMESIRRALHHQAAQGQAIHARHAHHAREAKPQHKSGSSGAAGNAATAAPTTIVDKDKRVFITTPPVD
jgi:hypothetical protein